MVSLRWWTSTCEAAILLRVSVERPQEVVEGWCTWTRFITTLFVSRGWSYLWIIARCSSSSHHHKYAAVKWPWTCCHNFVFGSSWIALRNCNSIRVPQSGTCCVFCVPTGMWTSDNWRWNTEIPTNKWVNLGYFYEWTVDYYKLFNVSRIRVYSAFGIWQEFRKGSVWRILLWFDTPKEWYQAASLLNMWWCLLRAYNVLKALLKGGTEWEVTIIEGLSIDLVSTRSP